MVTLYTTLGTFCIAVLAEVLHVRRCRRIAHLAFGQAGRPMLWTLWAPPLRVAALTAMVWSLTILATLEPRVTGDAPPEPEDFRRLLLVLDVSPSMQIADAGPQLQQRRSMRAHDLVRSLMDRVLLSRLRVSVIAVYTGAKEAVVDCRDPEVIYNILSDLPLEFVFDHGKTDLISGLTSAAELAADWPRDNVTVILLTDGDTVPPTGMPSMPRSVSDVLVIGVGNPVRGTYIDGHQSRQDRRILRQVARRLRGAYHDGNQHHVPTALLESLSTPLAAQRGEQYGVREWAILTLCLSCAALGLLPLLLDLFGIPHSHPVRLHKRNRSVPPAYPAGVPEEVLT